MEIRVLTATIMKLRDFWDVTSCNWYMGTNILKEPATKTLFRTWNIEAENVL
jgi:hypothetical protein